MSQVDPEIADQVYRPGEEGEVESFTWTPEKAERPRTIEVFGPEDEINVEIE